MNGVMKVLLSVLFGGTIAYAAAGSVAGRVIAADGGGALAGVNVRLAGTLRGTTTNMRGEYRLTEPPRGG